VDMLSVDLAESTWIFLVLSGSSDPDRKWTPPRSIPRTLLNSEVNLRSWCWSFVPRTVSLFLAFALESLGFDLGLAVCLQPCRSKQVFPKNTVNLHAGVWQTAGVVDVCKCSLCT